MAVVTYFANQALTRSLPTLVLTMVIGAISYLIAIWFLDGPSLKEEAKSWVGMIGQRKSA
jgi:hypothetical protein